ncbi:hypothetical protein OPV22_016641 [Ensete ventricosum]|uniref:Alpha-galactosidase n=1 Tax=Ensete ventricosum TaxID=4639 RepID=A0AAV8QR85_ENSVE|nr:hypothetical protein OPV22_016641 [Ensete ventricosum]
MGASALLLRLLCILFFCRSSSKLTSSPPRGWNSYDSFSWVVDEQAFLDNAAILAKNLHRYGYEYVVVDFLWYRKNVDGASEDSYGYGCIDPWDRPFPDPFRWPSSIGGKGFTEVARKVHGMGLMFGIHVMRGISKQAIDLGCSIVKLDCVFGDDLDSKEIITVSELLRDLDRPVLLSISPGTNVTPSMAGSIGAYMDMYRITADDWDKWTDVASHFDISRDFSSANLIGAKGLHGRSWPDLDMLPLGWLTDPGVRRGPHRKSNLTVDEQRTQEHKPQAVTLWSMAKSPLTFGGDLRNIDEITLSLITNPTLLEINSFSTNNKEFPFVFAMEDLKSRNHALNKRSMSQELVDGPENEEYEGMFQLLAMQNQSACLEASVKNTLQQRKRRITLSGCKWHDSQMWRLNDSGTLVNSYSTLCATTVSEAVSTTEGIRSWIGTGRKGEIYLSFFNLNSQATVISAKTSYIGKVFSVASS